MKIGIVTTWFERGAAYVSRQYRDVFQKQNEVYIYARSGEQYGKGLPEWEHDRVYWSKKKYFQLVSDIDLRDFKKWLIGNGIELVLFNEQRTWAPVILCRKLGIKTVAYIDYYKEDQVKYFDIYDALLCNTRRHYSVFEWHRGVHFIPWGTNVELFKPKHDQFAPIEQDFVTFFHSAGMSPLRKGTDLLLYAFLKLSSTNAKLIIHSQVDLTDSMPDMKEIINSMQASERLLCICKTVGAPGLYNLGDVYVYPTRLEGIGLSLIEALSCGLPAIVPDCAPMNEFVPPNCNWGKVVKIDKYISRSDGYYWPRCFVNVDDLKNNMEWYCENIARLSELKRLARNYVENQRDWSQNAKELNEIMATCKLRDVSTTILKRAWNIKKRGLVWYLLDPYFIKKIKKMLG